MTLKDNLFCVLFVLTIPCTLGAQATTNHDEMDSARSFVQSFYSWYLPVARKETKEPSSNVAIRTRGPLFGEELLRALREDAEAEARSDGDVVGLDFDPFLYSQDPSDRYDVGKISKKDGRYFAEVFGTRNGDKSSQPDVIVELVYNDSKWRFVNFHYPDSGSDLLHILTALKGGRTKGAK